MSPIRGISSAFVLRLGVQPRRHYASDSVSIHAPAMLKLTDVK
jgi:hypothetical protein